MKNWKKNSWRKYPVKHIPEYPNKKELDAVLDKIRTFPPLVFAGETRHLKDQLADVVDGKAFLLQGGDCAESFAEFNPDNIRDYFKLMLQMSLVLTYSASLPVVKLGRIAGQFSKPRSAPTEKQGDIELPSYLGDNINGMEFTEAARVPDPKRLFRAYSQSASTLNLIRAFSNGGFADLKKVHLWNLGYIKSSAYEAVDLSQSMLSLLEVNDSPSKSLSVNFDLRQLVMEILEEQERRVGSHIFAFSTIIAPEVPTLVVGNRTIIKQLICSMIRNVFISTSSPEGSQKTGIEFRIEIETLTETSAQFQLTASNQMTAANTITEKTRKIINLKLSFDHRIADVIQGKIKFEEKQGEMFYQLSTPLGWVIE